MSEEQKAEAAEKPAKAAPSADQQAAAAAKRSARAEGKSKRGSGAVKDVATEKLRRDVPARLRLVYNNDIRPKLMSELKLENPMQTPRLVKVTINMGLGEAVANPKVLDTAVEELAAMTGQKPVITRAKKSIAVFKLRAGQKIGCMVTLRREQMWEFLDRLISFALPRVRDFKGISPKGFDGRGNYTFGVREGLIFPETGMEKLDKPKGMNITITTTAETDEAGRALLRHLGMPFRN